jgi:hypothetical protein
LTRGDHISAFCFQLRMTRGATGATPLRVASAVSALLWSPGWTFLGAR